MLQDVVFLDAVQYVMTVLLGALAAWVIAQLAPGTVRGLKETWHVARRYRPDLVAAVDQGSDPLNLALARVSGVDAETWARVLPRVLNAVASALEEVLGDDEKTEAATGR